MRYLYEKPENYIPMGYGETYECNHPAYNMCTLYKIGDKGLAVVQQRFFPQMKLTAWRYIDPWLADEIYIHPKFKEYFDSHAKEKDWFGLYPTVTVRQIMWALRMKPLKKEPWETVFDRKIV